MQWLFLRLTHTWLCKFRCFLQIARYHLHSFLLNWTSVTFSHRKIINFHFETWYEKFIKRFLIVSPILYAGSWRLWWLWFDWRFRLWKIWKKKCREFFSSRFIWNKSFWIMGKSKALFLSAPIPSCNSLAKIPIYLLIWLKSYAMNRI